MFLFKKIEFNRIQFIYRKIVSNILANKEWIKEGHNGYFFNPGDKDKLKLHILKLINSNNRYLQLTPYVSMFFLILISNFSIFVSTAPFFQLFIGASLYPFLMNISNKQH